MGERSNRNSTQQIWTDTTGTNSSEQHVPVDLVQAEQTQTRALAAMEDAVGPNHPDTAAILTNLGTIQARLGRLDDAEQTQTRALTIKETALGPNHPDTAISLTNLASVRAQLGHGDDARRLLTRAFSIFVSTYGTEHPHTQAAQAALTLLDG